MKATPIGMPPGLEFKQPSLYKADELRLIHNSLDKFNFLALCSESVESTLTIASENVV